MLTVKELEQALETNALALEVVKRQPVVSLEKLKDLLTHRAILKDTLIETLKNALNKRTE